MSERARRRRTGLRLPAWLRTGAPAAAAALLALPAPAASQGGRGAQLEEILDRLADRAAVYERTALRFSCREEASQTSYGSGEQIKKQQTDYHDYLLEYTEQQGLVPYRALLSQNGKPARRRVVDPEYDVPEPYAWHLLFTRERRDRFQFDLIGPEVDPPYFTWVIEFKSLLSYVDGSTIDEWEGTAWVDQDTYDLIRIQAVPANQSATLKAKADVYRQSFHFLGMGTKERPRARELKAEFGIAREQLRFPSRVFCSTKLVDLYSGAPTQLKESVVLTYDTYVFYGVEAQERFEKLRAPGP